jgi:Gram-negative bacterial TonB protein C-terminal
MEIGIRLGPAANGLRNSPTGSKGHYNEVLATRLVIASTGATLIVGHESPCRISALACRIESQHHFGKEENSGQVSGTSDASKTQSRLIRTFIGIRDIDSDSLPASCDGDKPMHFILKKMVVLGISVLAVSVGFVISATAIDAQVASEGTFGAVTASSSGFQLELQSILDAATKQGDSQRFDDLIDNLRVPESPNWFNDTFGNEIGTRLNATYTSSWSDYRGNMKKMFRENATRKDTKVFVKEFSESSLCSADVFITSILNSATAPLVFYTASTGKKHGTDTLPGIYIFEQGAFRVVNWRTFYELPNVKPMRIRVGAEVAASQLVDHINPNRSSDSQKRIHGIVIIHVIIDRDGLIAKSEPVNGPPELANSALDAVRQRRYKAVSINGDPVEVDTTIPIEF